MERVQDFVVVRRGRVRAAGDCDVSVIMPTTSWEEPFESCARRVLTLLDVTAITAEFIVVHDGRAARRPRWLRRNGVRVMGTRQARGPAAARNKAAAAARGDVLFFVDADVELAGDALDRVHAAFAGDDPPSAVFGAYDDAPAAAGVVSQFRNLLHHHTHVTHPGRASSFWAGCGAVRAAQFHDVGGFDDTYTVPSVEDIELGTRIAACGGRIELDPLLRGKHHKRWTLRSMVVTDITGRAVPWTKLMLKGGRLPATLNVDWKNRISGVLAVAGLATACVAAVTGRGWPAAGACLAVVVTLNLDFYLLCGRRRGPGFALAAAALHFLFFVYSSLTFGTVILKTLAARLWSRRVCPSPVSKSVPPPMVAIAATDAAPLMTG